MPIIINFGEAKISAIAFTSREDFAEFMKKADYLFEHAKQYPTFYIFADPNAKEEDVAKIQRFIRNKMQDARDLEMIKRNIDAGRFPEITGKLIES